MPLTCIFSFSHNLFKTFFHRIVKIQDYVLFQNKPWVLHVGSRCLLKTLWKRIKLLMEQFSFSHNVFCTFGYFSTISINFKIVLCKLFRFGRVKTLSFGKGFIEQFSNIYQKMINMKTKKNKTISYRYKCFTAVA